MTGHIIYDRIKLKSNLYFNWKINYCSGIIFNNRFTKWGPKIIIRNQPLTKGMLSKDKDDFHGQFM